MISRKRIFLVFGLAAMLAIAGLGVAMASGGGGDGDDQPITGPDLTKCTAAALAEHPGGTVTETEVGDDGAAYSVEIRLEDGSEVEVNLDGNCDVIGQEADDDGPNGVDGPNDDSSDKTGS